MPRFMLTDASWNVVSRQLFLSNRVYNKPEHRMTVEGILYRLRTGIPWRDLPREFGSWNTVFRRFNRWSKKGLLSELFQALTKHADTEWLFIDGSIVKAHQHSAGAVTPADEARGKSRGGTSTKIHLAVDSGGLPVHFELSGAQVNDIVHGQSLVVHSPRAGSVVADKGYDSEAFRKEIRKQGAVAVIPRRSHCVMGNDDMDWALYRYRHLVENAFARLKQFRAIATRYDKLERNYHSNVALASAIIWLPMWTD